MRLKTAATLSASFKTVIASGATVPVLSIASLLSSRTRNTGSSTCRSTLGCGLLGRSLGLGSGGLVRIRWAITLSADTVINTISLSLAAITIVSITIF